MAESPTQQLEGSSKSKTPEICGICEKTCSRYCCPRCGLYYCSLTCYQSEKHSYCSESFYRDCVVEEMANTTVDKDSYQKMTDLLNYHVKQQEEYEEQLKDLIGDEEIFELDSDDEEVDSLEKRITNVNLNNADELWSVLTMDEKNKFEAILNQGNVMDIIPQWEPWWFYIRKEVFEVEAKEKQRRLEEEHLKKCPQLIKVPEFSTLSTSEPSACFKYNLMNVISSYAFIIRYFNGEIAPVETTVYLLSICDNLNHNTNFEEHSISTRSIASNCFKSTLIQTDETSIQVMGRDTFMILKGPSAENKSFYCRAALSHVHTIFDEAIKAEKKSKRSNKTCENSPKSDSKSLNNGTSPKSDSKSLNNGTSPISDDKTTNGNSDTLETNGKCVKNCDDSSSGANPKSNPEKEFSKKFPEHKKEHFPPLDISKVKKCMKKIEYYMSYVEFRNKNEIDRSNDNWT